ncbi:MAG: TonB-dependent receptor, partial [Brevundimonas sp.]|nr:TonB-dependent receptor [Brevundimonas sp.]
MRNSAPISAPRAYLVWNASDAWTFKGGVSQGFKTPSLEQLAEGIVGFGQQGRLPLLGSPGLTPETSTSTEVAAFYNNGGGFRASVTLFHNRFEDKIASGTPVANCTFGLTRPQYDAGGYPTTGCVDVGFWPNAATFGQRVNIDEAVTQGVETAVRWTISPDWTLSGNYTFTDSEQKSGAAEGLPLTDTPEHMVKRPAALAGHRPAVRHPARRIPQRAVPRPRRRARRLGRLCGIRPGPSGRDVRGQRPGDGQRHHLQPVRHRLRKPAALRNAGGVHAGIR